MNDEINEDRIDEQDRDRLHELLCKVVFGEATSDEGAEITAALETSEALRAQKAELEATVTLVRGAYTEEGAEALSAERFDAVVAAANESAPTEAGRVLGGPSWFARPLVRSAAAVLIVAGLGGIWWNGLDSDPTDNGGETTIADAKDGELGLATVDPDSQVASMGGFRADSALTPGDAQAADAAIKALEQLGAESLNVRFGREPVDTLGLHAQGAVPEISVLLSLEEAKNATDEFGNAVVVPPSSTQWVGQSLGELGKEGTFVGRVATIEPQAQAAQDPFDASGVAKYGLVGGQAPPEAASGQAGGGEGGVGAFVTPEATTSSAGGRYRGAGDTVPPAKGADPSVASGTPPTESRRGAGGGSAGLDADVRFEFKVAGASRAAGLPGAGAGAGGGGGGGPATPGPAGPSTPGPAAPGSTTALPKASSPSSKRSVPPADAPALDALGYGTTVAGDRDAETRTRAGFEPAVGHGSDDFFLGTGKATEFGDELYGYHRPVHCPPTRLPNERPRDMFFRFWGDNPFVITDRDAQSTFAADVDTASFSLARRMLREGFLPPREQVRTEEFVNFAKADIAPPTEGTFALHGELAPSPFGGREDRWLLRVGVRAAEIDKAARPPLALTFVVDTSGSMKENNRLELVKHAMRLLVGELDARDSIAIVRFSNEASEVLPPTSAAARDVIETALFQLQPNGSTNAEAGLKLGYSLAEQTLLDGVQTRVVLLSDGVANVGQTDQARIADDVSQLAQRGIFLNTIGVGMANHNDVFLEQMANKGQGVCDYVGDAKDARRAIVERFVGNFVTVAKDVKIQVEFDKTQVLRWRQLGYENRAVADADFRNDAIDAGEIGAGHQVACLYELELPTGADVGDAALATVRLRWKPVKTGEQQPVTEAREIERSFAYADVVASSFRAAPAGFRRAALSAQLAECLRRSTHARGDSMVKLGKELAQLLSEDRAEDTATIAEMTKRSIDLGLERYLPAPIAGDPDAAHRQAYYDALIESLGGADGAGEKAQQDAQQDAQNGTDPRTYESRIRELLERDRQEEGH